MHQAKILLPKKFDLPTILNLVREMDYYLDHDRIILDFTNRPFFAPFSMLAVASKLKWLRKKNEALTVSFNNYDPDSYLGHMGFFKMFGIDHGKGVGEAPGGGSYLPITELTRAQLQERPTDHIEEVQELVQRHADRLALVIARDEKQNKDLFDALSYAIREVMRNVFEHSESNSLYYCAQYWPKSNRVEFSVADFGIGIRKGLSENPNFRFKTDKQAIEWSLLPSVSGKTHLPRRSEVWFNSGYGLYMTNRLARNGGNFVIASGADAVHLTKKTKNNYHTSFPGTILRFNFHVNEIGNVSERLKQFKDEGHRVAREIAGSGNRPPSAMSLLIRRDFSL